VSYIDGDIDRDGATRGLLSDQAELGKTTNATNDSKVAALLDHSISSLQHQLTPYKPVRAPIYYTVRTKDTIRRDNLIGGKHTHDMQFK
jgi:hypothetical protein